MLFLIVDAAANGLDADGAGLPPLEAVSTGLVQRAPRLGPRRIAVGVRLGMGGGVLTRSAGPQQDRLVGLAGLARLDASAMLTQRFGGSLQLPVRLAATSDLPGVGTALGDARAALWGRFPVGRISASVGAELRVPTGGAGGFAGAGRAVPALLGGLTWNGPFTVDASLSLAHEGAEEASRALGGPLLTGAVGAHHHGDTYGLGLSLRHRAPLSKAIAQRRGGAAELAADGGVDLSEAVRASATISAGLTRGVGAPAWRAELGLVATLGTEPPPPPVVFDEVTVVDPDGVPVSGARLLLPDGRELRADAFGVARWESLNGPVEVRAVGLESVSTRQRGTVELPWATVPFEVRIATADGAPVVPTVELQGPTKVELGADAGLHTAQLLPGTYLLEVAAEGYGRQRRRLNVSPRRTEPLQVEVVLLESQGDGELHVRVVDPQERGIVGAEVRLDGISIGTLGQGEAEILGLAEKAVEVQVDSRYFADGAREVDLTEGAAQTSFELYYAPGTVRVVANGPSGPIPDGLVLVEGPRLLPPVNLGEHGERLIQLSEGDWTLVLSSPSFGLQERRLEVVEGGPVPLEAVFELLPEVEGTADLLVRVRDVDGEPIGDASVSLGGRSVGRTGTGGELRLDGLLRGEVELAVEGDGLTRTTRSVFLDDGPQVVTLGVPWDDGSLQVAARSGPTPVDARVDFAGPAPYEGAMLGPPGQRLFTGLPLGEWEIIASHPKGMEVAWTTLGGQEGRLAQVAVELGDESGPGSLDLRVVDPERRPIRGARVHLDGTFRVETASGGRVRMDSLREGLRELTIEHPLYQPDVTPVELTPDTEVVRELAYRSGLVELVVTAQGQPVTDALAYFDGPAVLEPVDLGPDGQAIVPAGPGTWEIVVSSGAYGIATRRVELPGGARPPERVSLELLAGDTVLVQVVDPRGQPVPGVELSLGDGTRVRTGASGTAQVPFDEEHTALTVAHPGILPVQPVELSASRREQRVEIAWAPRPVKVSVRREGEPVEALVRATGPSPVESVVVLGGQGSIALTAGRWEVIASAEGLGARRLFVEVPPTGEIPPISFELSPARVRQTAEGLELVDVRFALGADIADDTFLPVLEEIAATVIGDPRIEQVEVQGHTDPTGGTSYNFDLSRRRALSIVAALVRLGVPPDMLVARGYGPSRPVAPNDSEDGRARNRRVDFKTELVE